MMIFGTRSGRLRRLALLLPVLVLTACGGAQMPSRQSITPGETISVEGNQNVYAVAKAHNVSMRDLIVLNDLKSPFNLKPGQKLVLPAGSSGGVVYGSMAPVPAAAPLSAIQSAPVTSLEPTAVQSEELPPPPITKPSISKTGNGSPVVETLNSPSTAAAPVATTVTGAKAAPVPLAPAAATANPVVSTNMVMKPAPAPASAAAASSEEAPSFTATWPVQGPVLSGFGPKGQGLNNDGVNIGAPKGSPVLASASGIVVYAGNEMKGFGNLVLIRHQNKWVTAYAHLDRILVNKDAVVAQGDMIGTVGKTGNVPSPQLHFETRYDGKPVDPKSVIKSGT